MVTTNTRRRAIVRRAPVTRRIAGGAYTAPRRSAAPAPRTYRKKFKALRTRADPRGYLEQTRTAMKAPKRSFLGTVGEGVGSLFGSGVGGLAGMAGDAFSKVLGLGAYSVKNNVLVEEMVTGKQVPVMHSSDESVIIRHREYIADISSTTAFTNRTFSVNPGLASTFPWLASIASNFEQYKWRGLIFEFKSTSANALNSTNTALGSVSIASEYNVNGAPFINKSQVLNNMWTCTAKPSETFIHPIECAPEFCATTSLYVRSAAPAGHQDLRLYDLVNVQVVTDGSQAAANVGELWCSYEIELFKPQIGVGSTGLNSLGAHYRLNGTDATHYLGTSQTSRGDYIGLAFPTANLVTFPVGTLGKFLVQVYYYGDSTACGSPSFPLINCAPLNFWRAGANAVVGNTTHTDTEYILTLMIEIIDATIQASFGFSGGTLPANITAADLVVQQVNGNLLG